MSDDGQWRRILHILAEEGGHLDILERVAAAQRRRDFSGINDEEMKVAGDLSRQAKSWDRFFADISDEEIA